MSRIQKKKKLEKNEEKRNEKQSNSSNPKFKHILYKEEKSLK